MFWFKKSKGITKGEGSERSSGPSLSALLASVDFSKPFVSMPKTQFYQLQLNFKLPVFHVSSYDKNYIYFPTRDLLLLFPELKPPLSFAEIGKERYPELSPTFQGKLYPYQVFGTYFLLGGGSLLFDEMGLGKSVQALAAIDTAKLYPTLIICPAFLKENWAKEIRKWLPEKSILIASGKTKKELIAFNQVHEFGFFSLEEQLVKADFLILNYEILSSWLPEIKQNFKPKAILFDEAHFIKNYKAKRTKFALKLISFFEEDNARVFFLTGTPLLSRPKELYPLLSVVSPAQFKDFRAFMYHYCFEEIKTSWAIIRTFNGAHFLNELRRRMEGLYLRRRKDEVLKDLPSLRIIDLLLSPQDFTQFSSLKALENKLLHLLNSSLFYSHFMSYLKALGLIKARALLEWIKAGKEELREQKFIIFCYFHSTEDFLKHALEEEGFKVYLIRGTVSPNERSIILSRFRNEKEPAVLIAGIECTGLGLNLQFVNLAIILELQFVPAIENQAIGRLHRIGQENSVIIYRVFLASSYDERILDIQTRKKEIAKALSLAETSPIKLAETFAEVLKEMMRSEDMENRK
jgi:SWI/SNF-related matrix-associated actin-dependent regulator 1 of chromatin subfamily A